MGERTPIDGAKYLRMFPIDTPGTLAMIIKLVRVTPRVIIATDSAGDDREVIPRIRGPAERLRESGVFLQHVWKTREETGTTKLRPFDIEWDAAWAALLARIEPWAIFERVQAYQLQAEQAEQIIGLIFAKRLDFTQLELNKQWVQGNTRLDTIRTHDLRETLVALAGAPFVERVEETHEKLGRALGLLGDPPDADLPLVADLAKAKAAAHAAITAYALQLLAADPVASEALSKQIRRSLAVIDSFRPRIVRTSARPIGSDTGSDAGADTDADTEEPVEPIEPVDPDTPIPPLPAD